MVVVLLLIHAGGGGGGGVVLVFLYSTVSFKALQASCLRRERESYLFRFDCVLIVVLLLVFCVSYSWCRRYVCDV